MNERVEILTSLRLDMNKPYIQKWPEVRLCIITSRNSPEKAKRNIGTCSHGTSIKCCHVIKALGEHC